MYDIKQSRKRIQAYRKIALTMNAVIFLVGSLALLAFAHQFSYRISEDFLMTVFVILAVMVGAIGLITNIYQKKAVKIIMPYVITKFEDKFGNDFVYSRDYDFSQRVLEDSGLVDTGNKVVCSDMIKVQYLEGDKMSLSNIKTYKVTKNKNGKKRKVLLDSGIFIDRKTELKSGVDFVIRDKQYFASKTMYINGKELNLIKKVQSSFDKKYSLYTSDAIKAFRFLSPSVVEKFLKMATIKGHVSELSIFDNQVYLFINKARIDVAIQSLLKKPNIEFMIEDSYENINEILKMIEFIYSEQRIQRLSSK